MLDRSLYPRVTTVLHEGFKDGDLEGWAIKMAMRRLIELYVNDPDEHPNLETLCNEASGASKEIMRNAARRGTATHHLIEGKTREELQIVDGDWESVGPMYESFKLWASERNFTPLANEVPIWSDRYGYRGTLDCVGLVDGRLELIDWKTSNAIRKDYRLQTAAYWTGLREVWTTEETRFNPFDLKGIRVVRFGGRSDKETQIKNLVTYEELIIDGETEIAEDFETFLAAKKIYDWKLKRK